jgi:hypothetical protein
MSSFFSKICLSSRLAATTLVFFFNHELLDSVVTGILVV